VGAWSAAIALRAAGDIVVLREPSEPITVASPVGKTRITVGGWIRMKIMIATATRATTPAITAAHTLMLA
jgi:hypothetical protein